MQQSKSCFSVSAKILLIASSFSLPIAVLVYLVVKNIDSYIDFGSMEARGNVYQRPLEDLLDHVQGHELVLAGCKAASPDCGEKLANLKSRIDQAFEKLTEVDRRYGVSLQFTPEGLAKRKREHLRVATVRSEWEELADLVMKTSGSTAGSTPGGSDAAGKEIAAKYDHLVSDIRGMITHAGDTSNLILDPDLDSYYLMDVTLLALPQVQDRLGKVALYGQGVLERGNATQDERIKLAVDAALLTEADLDRVSASTETSLNEDANFYGVSPTLAKQLRPALEQFRDSAARFIALTRQIAGSERPNVQPQAYAQAGIEAREASFAYWNTAVTELDRLLYRRVASYISQRTWGLALAALAVVTASLLAFFLARSITRPLHGLVESLGPGATLLGVCAKRIAETSQDKKAGPEESAIICEELNAHVESMRKAVMELVAQVQGAAAGGTTAPAFEDSEVAHHA